MLTFGIMAYNEQENIGLLLNWLSLNYRDSKIVVVASGCTDETIPICQQFQNVTLVIQPVRKGKASAINLFLEMVNTDLVCLLSADCIPDVMCVERLVADMADGVGITSPRVVTTKANKLCETVWNVCHELSMINPKMGEMIVFRNIVRHIESDTSVDEATIQGDVIKAGFKAVYVPDAVVFNKGCSTLRDLISQRRRIYHGHLKLKEQGYAVSSMSYGDLARASMRCFSQYLIPTIALEIYARVMAALDYRKGKGEQTIWERCSTTKRLV